MKIVTSTQRFLLLLLSTTTPTSHAYLLKSTGTGGWATGFARNDNSQSLVIVATIYTGDSFWGQSISSANPQCMIVQALREVEDDLSITKSVQTPTGLSPDICVGGGIIFNHGIGAVGAVMGTSAGGESSLQILDNVVLGQNIVGKQTYSFPDNTIPVASTVSVVQGVFVGLQSTRFEYYEKTNVPAQDLVDFIKYWETFTQPPHSVNEFVQVIRYDFMTEQTRFSTDLPTVTSGRSAVIASMVTDGETSVLVAGSTNESGTGYGPLPADRDAEDTDWDGYIAFLNAGTGDLEDIIRIASQPGKNDIVHDICGYSHSVYIVGSTEGHMTDAGLFEGGSFLLKMDLTTKEFEYKLTIPAVDQAIKCVATSDGIFVGFYITKELNPLGGTIQSQDVVVTKFSHDINDHDAIWSQWLDTTEPGSDAVRQDYLVGMEYVADTGNIAVLMNSADLLQGLNDIVLVELDSATGANDLTSKLPTPSKDPNTQQDVLPPDHPNHPSNVPKNNVDTTKSATAEGGVDERKATIWVAIAMPVFLAISVLSYHFGSNSRIESQTSNTASGQEETDPYNI